MSGSALAPRSRAAEAAAPDARYLQLVELAPDGILIHQRGRVVFANAAAVRLTGADRRSAVVGQPIDRFFDPPYLKSVAAQLSDTIELIDSTRPVRDTLRRCDGATVEVEVRAVGFIHQGQPAAHVVVRDISDRLALELASRQLVEELHRAHQLESVGSLAGGMAHEVHNMMQVVLGFSDFLVRHKELPKECLSDVHEIMHAADRATTVTRQLLAFSRRAIHRPAVVDLGEAVRNAASMLRLLLGEGRRLVVEADASARTWMDASQLEQVLINLTLNARDAMPGGGTFTITTSVCELLGGIATPTGGRIPPGRYASIALADTGCGIDPRLLGEIFEPFFTTKGVGKGAGLGLAAVQGILGQNNGFVSVASKPDDGATFTVYLPALREGELGMRHPEVIAGSTAASHAGVTILVVDDEAGVRRMAARVLERDGYRVLEAAGGAEALEMVGRLGPPQLVLTDLMMPGVGGFQLTERLRAQWPVLPILMMSGYSLEELHRSDPTMGTDDLLQKPFSASELTARVAAAIARTDVHLPGVR